ncbi:heparin lyase I family protein [Vibrio sp. ZSDZ65]|uniref:Heparin lyase I family protein n=1 Tax=Vibrio qingdaonensis TaxID=2829491 RepID=A0A9X3CPN6_9VIBR|nr:heparin lyase I family protein [Vibrio qingdaonensis]MCW8347432.1 heparin lyase I family protein [Vibrio qingdaonensis]
MTPLKNTNRLASLLYIAAGTTMILAPLTASLTASANALDTDGDGIIDSEDVYPWDPDKHALPTHLLPAIVEAEDYDLGGQNIAYFETTEDNRGGKNYRNDAIDISNHSGYFHVGWFARSEWMNYTVEVPKDAYFEFSAWLGSTASTTKNLELAEGSKVLAHLPFLSSTQVAREFEPTDPQTIYLTQGKHTLTLRAIDGSVRVDKLQFNLSPLSKDSDGDGIVDAEDAFPNDPNEWIDTDQDGIGNNQDLDDDGDGVNDDMDDYPLDASRWENQVTMVVPDSCDGLEDKQLLCDVLSNDVDPEQDELQIIIDQAPRYGTLTITAEHVLYTPNVGFVGLDDFTYSVDDGFNRSESAVVDIQVNRTTPINNAAPIYTAGWENGTLHSELPGELTPSFSSDLDSLTKEPTSYHYYQTEAVPWARTGERVLKVFGEPPAYRSEAAFMSSIYRFSPGEESYYSASIRPDESWQTVTKYSVIITQWKSFSSGPHAAIRLSNDGKFALTYHSSGQPVVDLGTAPQDTWTDIRVYFKKSLGDDGHVKVWVNGELKLDRAGKTLLVGNDGYMKFGMYTEIRSPKTLYFDNISVSKAINRSLAEWGQSPVDGIYNDSDEDGISNGLDRYPFDATQ